MIVKRITIFCIRQVGIMNGKDEQKKTDHEIRLEEVKKLHDVGFLTQEEYQIHCNFLEQHKEEPSI